MSVKRTSLQSSDMQAATGATRDEILKWRQWLNFPLANEAPGKAMRYSLINGIEYTLLKHCVSRGVPHEIAAGFIGRRLQYAIRKADHARLAITTSVISHPAEWLAGSEFDCLDIRRSTSGVDPNDIYTFWSFEPHSGGFKATSLHDLYEITKENGPRLAAYRDAKGLEHVEFEESPMRAVEAAVFGQVARGSIVIEILWPLRRFYANAFGRTFIPGDTRVHGEEADGDEA